MPVHHAEATGRSPRVEARAAAAGAYPTPRRTAPIALALLVLALIAPFVSLAFGAAAVPVDEAFRIVVDKVTGTPMDRWEPTTVAIIWLNRVPRILTAYGVGIILGVSGVAMQAVVRNPLAEPYILGVSSGAAAGAATAIVVLGTALTAVVAGSAFAGAVLAILVVLWLGSRGTGSLRLVLAGVATGFAFQAVTNLLVIAARDAETAQSVIFWSLGSLARADLTQALAVLVVAIVLSIGLWLASPYLDALTSGDDTCLAIGVNPSVLRLAILVPVSGAVALTVATAGGIGFIGLVVPHLVRPITNHRHRPLVLLTPLVAALFLLATDTVARTVLAPAEIPIGVITALLGAPFLMVMIGRASRVAS